MRTRVVDLELSELLAKQTAGHGDSPSGLVFEARTGLSGWTAAEDELAEAFALTREAVLADAPVVYVVRAEAILGRGAPLDAAVATGLLGGARALTFERRKNNCYVSVLAVGTGIEPTTVAESIELLVATRGANGQIFPLGTDHLGAALP
ncbi:hypothetical protein [Nocardia ignorata]|uniref:Uncharacterized protein n=1 Tax=Nocardia ignorata TaxID=145285 RepID=A0A4R6PI90_NOCIG|nr:hypothetical protein [Nocardia ignorata]TDP37807.1 hypothetical protein DFR75_104157 [Nocardia ignorata]